MASAYLLDRLNWNNCQNGLIPHSLRPRLAFDLLAVLCFILQACRRRSGADTEHGALSSRCRGLASRPTPRSCVSEVNSFEWFHSVQETIVINEWQTSRAFGFTHRWWGQEREERNAGEIKQETTKGPYCKPEMFIHFQKFFSNSYIRPEMRLSPFPPFLRCM